MAGYRIGYVLGSEVIIENIIKMQENVCACAPFPSQYVSIEAYDKFEYDNSIREKFEERIIWQM